MPAKNGFEVCEVAKNDPALKAIPILLLIGILDDFDEEESRRVGADGFIIKPFEANAAIGKVREALTKAGTTQPPVEPGGQTEEIVELADIVAETPATPVPPSQGKGTEDILDLGDALEEPKAIPVSTSTPQEKQAEDILDLGATLKEPATTPIPTPPKKQAEDILDLGDIVAQSPPEQTPPPQEKLLLPWCGGPGGSAPPAGSRGPKPATEALRDPSRNRAEGPPGVGKCPQPVGCRVPDSFALARS